MGDAQSAQRGEKKDAAAEEESGKVDDAQEENIEEKPLKNTGQISEINGKADCSTAEVNGHCRDEIAAEDGDVSETGKPLKEDERPLENVEISENNSPMEADTNEDVPLEIDAKQNDINESFRRFFSNIGLKLTVKRGSGETPTDEPDKSNQEEPNRPEDIEDATKETKHENAERNTDVNIAQETYDNDSATCHTLTDITSEDVLENAEEQTAETKEVESDNADAATTSPVGEDAQQDATPEEEPHSTSPSCPEDDVVISPIKRFFTTGIFSGLRKKKKRAEDETTEKEFVDMAEVVQMTEQTVQDQQHDKEEISQGVEAAAVETEHKDNELKKEILYAASAQTTDEEKSPTKDPSTIIINESEILSSQEKDKVHASPLKRLLSGSSLKKLSKMQRSRKSSDAKLSDSGEHVSDQLISSTESAENQKEGPAQPSVEAAGEEDSPWASFKKLVTPKKRMKRPSVSNEETQIPGSLEEPKPSEGEQISDHSTEEGKKRKDSSVSWEAVLCGSGRRRSRKTSDSEDETPQIDNNDNKKDGGSKHGAELLLESSYETDSDILASSPRQAGSSSEGDGGSTWKSLKRLVTPKRKAKDENESKDNEQSDSEVTHDESFSIKKLLPGRRKRKSAEKQDQVSSDEAEKDVASDDEDSDTPAVVPLSEFDTVETEVHIQIWADVESHLPEEADNELQQDLLDKMTEPVLPCDSLQTEAKQVQDNDALEKLASTTLVVKEEPDDLTESVSNHQQLSDIPEEGIITETMVTPASVTEEAARDDTLAEDLIEITSEAITAPEPASDITLADETEMISAVSQLSSESSKTSGNTTPVPAQYDAMETDVILHQVVETISISAKAVPVCSVSHQILETFEKEPTILEIHRRLDASAINTGLNVEEFDAINELTAQTESISEVNYSVSTEIVSEVHTEEFDTAEIAVDEVHFTDPEESTGESYDKEKCLSELNASVSTDTLPEGEEMVLDEGSLVDAHRAETEPAKIYSQETGSPATVSDETKDGAKEQEVLTLTEKEDQIMQNITGQIQLEDKDQPPLEAEELQELAAVQAATLDSEERSVQLLEKEVISEDIRAAKTITYEPKEETVPLNEVNIDPEKKDELETDAAKNNHVQEAEALACSVQSQEEEVNSEDIPTAKTVIDEPKQTAEHLPEVSAEPENKELPVNAVKTEHQNVQKPEILDAVQTPTLNSEDGSVQSLEKEVNSEDVPKAKTVTDELKEETIPLIEVNLEQVDASNTEHVHQALKAVQSTTLDLGAGSLLSIENEEMSEDILVVETVTDEPKQEIEVRFEPKEKAAKTENVQEPDVLPPDVKHIVPENKTEEGASMYVHGLTQSTVGGSTQELEKFVLLEDISKPEDDIVIESEVVAQLSQSLEITEDQSIPQDAEQEECIPEVVDMLQTLTAVQLSSVNEEASNVQVLEKTVISEETTVPCLDNAAVTDEHKHEVRLSVVQVSVEGEKESEYPSIEIPKRETELMIELEEKVVQELQILPSEVQDIVTETKTEEGASMYMHVVTESTEGGSAQELEKFVLLEDVPTPDADNVITSITDKTESEVVSQLDQPLEISGEQKTESIPQDVEQENCIPEDEDELQTLPAVNVSSINKDTSNVQVLEKTVISEETPAPSVDNAAVTDEHKHEVHLSVVQVSVEGEKGSELKSTDIPKQEIEARVEPEEKVPVEDAKTEHVQELQVLPSEVQDIVTETKTEEGASMYMHVVTESTEGGSAQELEKFVLLEDVPTPDADNVITSVTDETESEVVSQLDHPLEISREQKTESIPKDVEQKDCIPEDVDELQRITAVQLSCVNEEASNVQVLEKTVISEETAVPCLDNAVVIDEHKHEVRLSVVQVSVEGEKGSELKSIDIPKQEIEARVEPEEKVPVEDAKTEHVQELHVLPSEVQDIVTETKTEEGASMYMHVVTESTEGGSAQELEKFVLLEDVPTPDADNVITSVTDETESEVVSQLDHPLEISREQKTESIPKDVEQKDCIPEDVDELQRITAVQLSCVNEEASNVQVLEKTVISEETAVPCLDNAVVIDEHKHEVRLSVVQVSVEGEKGSELKSIDIPKQEIEARVEPEEKVPVEDAKTEHVQELHVLPSEVQDIVTETKTEEGASMYMHVVTESTEGGSAQELEKFVLLEDVPTPDADNVIILVTDETESEVVSQLDQPLEISREQKTESIPKDVEQKDCIPEDVDELQRITAVQLSCVNEEASNVQVLEKTVISEETAVPCLDNAVVIDEHKHEVRLSVVQVSVEGEKGSELKSIDIPKQEIEARVEPEEKVPVEDAKTEHVQELHVLPSEVQDIVTETKSEEGASMYMHVVTESTEGGSAQELEKFVLLEDVPTPDADNVIILVTDETESEVVSQLDQPLEISREQKTESIPKDVEQKDCIPEDVDELQRITAVQLSCVNEEASNVQVLEKTVISEETAVPCLDNAVVIDEHKHEVRLSVVQVSVEGEKGSELKSIEIPKQEIEARVEPEEKVPVEDAKTEHVQELQVLPSDVKDIVTETKSEEGASMYMHVVTESTEGGSAQELEKFVLLDVPTPDADNVITSITDKTESEVVSQLDQALEISGEQKTESIPQEVEQENCIPEDVDELQTLPAVNLSSINEAASNVQVLENTDNDNAAVTDEHKYEDHESELPSTEIKTVAIEHAVVAQVVTCNLKEVLVAIPDVLIEKTSDITEPLIDRMASEQVFREEVESATPLVKDEEGSLETVVESLLEVGVTEAKEVIDVCHETVKRVEILSTTPETEEGLINEEKHVTIQEVFQHIKENLPETVPQSVVVSFEQEVKQHHDAMTEVSELVESESNEMKDQEAMKSSIGTLRGRQEAPTVMNDEFATEQVSDDCMQTSDIPGSLDVSIHGHKEDLDVTKDEWEQSEAGVTANEVKPPSEELDVKTNSEQAPTPQIAQSLIVTPSNTGLVIPQNTGIISSIGNVESPSSLSLEFKLNIQFGQAKAPASSSTTTERTEPVKQMSEVGVQAVEAVKPINLTQRDESQKQTELTEVAVQVITEPATHLDSTERPVITSQPVLLDIGIQAMEKVGSEEQIKSTDTEISSVQATETLQAVGQTEKIEVFLSQPVLSEGCNQETKAEEPVKQEEENDQDVWMDAEEVIYTQKETEVSLFEVEESPGPQAESNTEEKAGLQHEVEMASYSKTEEDGSQQEMHRTGGMCEIESDGEDFAVALEHPETATASITTMEWD